MELDALDKLSAKGFDGYIVRKDLVRRFKGQYPVPTYVCEFLLGRYCASIDPAEIEEGLQIVSRQLSHRAVRAGEEELFKSRSREQGSVKIIDIIKGRLDAKTDSYLAELPSLSLNDARISSELVHEHERMLTGGFYAEVTLVYDAAIAQEKGGRPFGVEAIRPIQLSKREVLDSLAQGREMFTTEEWKRFLIRSIGLEPEALSERTQDIVLLRIVPFVERNYNMVELGPRGTGKSHIFQQVSPYSHLVSGGKATVARMTEFRRMHLNAIVWSAGMEVPPGGVESALPDVAKPKQAESTKPINALIVTGGDHPGHKWRETTPALLEALWQDERFLVDVTHDPEMMAKTNLSSYGVILMHYCNWKRSGLSVAAKQKFREYLFGGGGLSIIHFANGAFHHSLPEAGQSDWPEYRKICRRVWDHSGGSGHDGFGRFRVEIATIEHPITKGMKSFETTDELYCRQRGELPIEVLAVARSKMTGRDEPMAWVNTYGKGRVFQTVLGHAPESIRGAGPAELIRRGSIWAARR